MASSLDEQILDLVVSKLAGITTGNGYEETVLAANILRGSGAAPQSIGASSCPGLHVRLLEKQGRWHLRGAEEVVLLVEIICVVDSTLGDEGLADLSADVRKLVYANEFWHNGTANLARRSWVVEDGPHEVEITEETLSARVLIGILYRADRTNPFVTKAV